MTASCVYSWILSSSSEQLFYGAPLGNCLFNAQVAEFQPKDKYFVLYFQVFYTRMRSSHPNA